MLVYIDRSSKAEDRHGTAQRDHVRCEETFSSKELIKSVVKQRVLYVIKIVVL